MAIPGADFPPNNPDTLASNMEHLRIDESNQQQSTNAGASGAPLPFGQQLPSFAAGQSRPPPFGVLERGPPAPPVAPGHSTLPPDMMPVRPTGPTPLSQPPPFASRPPPPGVLPSSFGGGSAAPTYSRTGPRPGPSGPPTPPQISFNGPPAFVPRVMQTGSRPPPPMDNAPRPSSSVGQPAPPFSAIRQGPLLSGPSQHMQPPPGSLPFPPPLPQGTVQSSDHLYGMETGRQQPPQLIQMRDTMPAVFFFLIDVSMHAIQNGATEAACSAIRQVIPHLPEGPRTMVGIATFDSSIYFCNLKRALPQPFPNIQDVCTLESDVVQLAECRQNLELLLDSIPSMFQNSGITDSAFEAVAEAVFLAMKNTGGKLLVFQSSFPSVGIGSLSAREAESRSNISSGDKEPHKLLQPVDKALTTMAYEFAEYQVYYYFSALDPAKLFNDLRWNVTRPQGFEAVLCERCSQVTSLEKRITELQDEIKKLAEETVEAEQRAVEAEESLSSMRGLVTILEKELTKADVHMDSLLDEMDRKEAQLMAMNDLCKVMAIRWNV